MARAKRILLIASTLVTSWLGMQATHELGHVLGAIVTGATVENVALHPLGISRTDVGDSRFPRTVVWSGPILGAVLPLILWQVLRMLKSAVEPLARFFTGFCLIANGLYLGFGSIEGIGDCGELIHLGTPHWHMWLFAGVTVPAGFWVWNELGRHYGVGKSANAIDPAMTATATVLAALLVVLGLWVGE